MYIELQILLQQRLNGAIQFLFGSKRTIRKDNLLTVKESLQIKSMIMNFENVKNNNTIDFNSLRIAIGGANQNTK